MSKTGKAVDSAAVADESTVAGDETVAAVNESGTGYDAVAGTAKKREDPCLGVKRYLELYPLENKTAEMLVARLYAREAHTAAQWNDKICALMTRTTK